MGELVPYIPRMQQNQGCNAYPGQLCVASAVTVETLNEPGKAFQRDYRSELLEECKKLAKCLKISAGATVSGWGQSGQINVSFLDRSEFEDSTFTPINTFGDCFTADFILSGRLFVQVSITARDSSQTQQLKQLTKVAFSKYGVEGKVTQEVESAIEKIRKNSLVCITIHESTGVSSGSDAVRTKSKTTDLLTEKADKCFADIRSGKRNCLFFAVLGKYKNLSNIEDGFIPLDYSEAGNRSCTVLGNFTMYQAIGRPVKAVPTNKFKGGARQPNELSNKAIDNSTLIRDRARFHYSAPMGDDNWADIAATVKDSTATEILRFKAFDLGEVFGTELVSIRSSISHEDYVSLIGERASNIDGWREESHFCIFPNMVESFAIRLVAVSSIVTKDYIRLYAVD